MARGETCRYKLSPTLSYTQTLENKVKELERLVTSLQSTAACCSHDKSIEPTEAGQEGLNPGEKAISNSSGNQEGLIFDSKKRITYHGATSFFQLPEAAGQHDASSSQYETATGLDNTISRREKLVNNAWLQRILESSFETPVSIPMMSSLPPCNLF